ncbi:N-acetylmuramoyl-L-alanine amidase [Paenibacillus sp. UASWS1643]|uniref:N-acetylmuramoyl-L-alanine amidase n=1 Tax=Paenibacillus sp. UASWS1643 TaxID=2580422 RepID=UPI0012393FFD|nr:peptidoglycan recognition family protein [Paenibacillus sp. UASWS1643]KAA8750082.1 N-acetylmuramoyl-L-alanine amidase [Paenibacillus sp. UASWS1643]
MYKITQKGNKNTNFSSRDGNVPVIIVNHISGGSMSSMDSWFQSSGNTVSSAHFGVSKSGEIHQYVAIDKMAWANGLKVDAIKNATAPIIKERAPTNPNKYSVSIEHEGTDGELTDAQFQASVWLHFYIQTEVKRIYGKDMILDERHVIGHFQVDPKRKPFCPGPKFPWTRLYQAIKPIILPATPSKEGEPMTADEKKEFEQLKADVKDLQTRVNINGDQTPPKVYHEALEAAKFVKAITTTNDKDQSALKILQMMYNMGLFEPRFIEMVRSYKRKV